MTPKEQDDFFFQLGKMAQFYNKPSPGDDKLQRSIWMEVFYSYDIKDCIQAMTEYFSHGKFMPKPSELLTLVKEIQSVTRSRNKGFSSDEPDPPRSKKLAAAWITFMSVAHEGWGIGKKSYMDFEEAQEIVNKHCQTRLSDPTLTDQEREQIIESVPDTYKLEEYWG